VKLKVSALVVLAFLASTASAKTVLPDACGDSKTNFDVKTQADQPEPAAPAAGKAQIVFIETIDKPFGCGMSTTGCSPTYRFGLDGTWAGATKGNSYFVVSVDPGVHHVCTVSGKNVGVDSFTAEAGKVYYYQAKVVIKRSAVSINGPDAMGSGQMINKDFDFSQVNEDQGKYRIKASELATSTPKK
jgi:hypothetical protein